MDGVPTEDRVNAMPAAHLLAIRSLILVLLWSSLCVAIGCESAPKATDTIDAESAYRRGDFVSAERLGREAMQSEQGLPREEAAYIAGLSAAKRGDLEAATRDLQIAAASSDADLAARANASLGAVERARGEDSASRQAFRRASTSPDPLIADRAERLAGDARGAGGAASTSGPSSGFVVQAGAFSTEQAARARASSLASTVRQAGFGDPRVVRIRSRDGKSLWAVQIGAFSDRRQAGAARDRLGHPEWAIEASGSR